MHLRWALAEALMEEEEKLTMDRIRARISSRSFLMRDISTPGMSASR